MSDNAQRMYVEALNRLHDADLLSQSLSKASDSDAILRILGFEVLLKCAVLLDRGSRPFGHEYASLWAKLSAGAQQEIMAVAMARMPGHVDLSHLNDLFLEWEFVFKKARYYYELYENKSLKEQQEIGDPWVEAGAPISEAAVKYFPLELSCLIEGLRSFIEAKLA